VSKPQFQPPAKGVTPANLRRRRTIQWILVVAGMLSASIVSATAGALLAFSLSGTPLLQRDLTAEESSVFSQDSLVDSGLRLRLPRLTRPVNVLVMGTSVLSSDVNDPPTEAQGLGYHAQVNVLSGLTDVMLLVRFDPLHNDLKVLSIPRDTRTFVPNMGMTKINAANVQGGPAVTAQVVSELLGGVGIDRYAILNIQGVEKLVDALGGVELYVPKDMNYQDDSQHLYINLKEGQQHLNGNQALQFLRFRYDNYGDIGRIQRQQLLLRALMEQSLNPRTIANLPEITNVIRSHVDTNLSMEELLALLGFASKTDRSSVEMLMLPGDFSTPEYDASYWLPNYAAIDQLVQTHLKADGGGITVRSNETGSAKDSTSVATPESLRITIQNSTAESAVADEVADTLYDRGYGNLSVGYNYPEALGVTRIIAQNGDRQTAESLRDLLQLGEVRIENTGDLNSDITIQVGSDWLRSQWR
jgi:polyisoprenyl-teichoic acid--peptidoglycan teichoic acid transferase